MGQPTALLSPKLALARDADTLRGLEGQAAHLYFAALGELLPGWEFLGRAYRPPPDPVNAALSFAYSLLLGRSLAAVVQAGLHPALGTLHVSHGRRPALALDLMEPFRAPVCDLTVAGLLRSGRLPRDQFEQRGTEVRLGKAGCAVIQQAFSRRCEDWRINTALQQQLKAVRHAWTGQECPTWQPPVRA